MTAFYLDRTGDRSGEFVVRSLKEFSEKLLDGLGSRS
jgi:hypothetical protein